MVEKKKMSKIKKSILITFASLFSLIFVIIGIFYGIFFNEVNAYFSIKQETENIYSMTYKNNYFFDDFLQIGAKTDSELKNFIVKKLLHGFPIDFELPDYGCSSFTATTQEGGYSFARNLDIEFAPIMIVKTYPQNGYSSISMVNLSALGFTDQFLPNSFVDKLILLATPYIPFDGMNEKGVAISVNMVNGSPIEQNTDKIDITTTTLIRLVLDKASNVEEAINLISQFDLHDSTGGPYHFQIADNTGESVVIEYYENKMQIIKSDECFQVLTNHALNKYETSQSTFIETYERYQLLNNKIKSLNGILTIEQSLNLLQDVKLSWGGYDGGCEGGTLYSAVYDLDNLNLYFIYRGNLNQIFKFQL